MSNVQISKTGQEILQNRSLAFKVLKALHDKKCALSNGESVQIEEGGKTFIVQISNPELIEVNTDSLNSK